MRVGILGGTFDPVHLGHLIMAEQCREQARLDQVLFIPSARPPHKQATPLTGFEERVEMLELALAGQPAFRVDDLEKERPGLSYTADTLEELRRRLPDSQLFLLVGSDILPDLPSWYNPAHILELARLLVVARPGLEIWSPERLGAAIGMPADARLDLEIVLSPLIDISSRDVRRRVAEGRTIRYLVPRAVECYILAHRLYRS